MSEDALRLLVNNGFAHEAVILSEADPVERSTSAQQALTSKLATTGFRPGIAIAFCLAVLGFVLLSLYQPMTGLRGKLVGSYHEVICEESVQTIKSAKDIHGISGIEISCKNGGTKWIGSRPPKESEATFCEGNGVATGYSGFTQHRLSSLYLICRGSNGTDSRMLVAGKDEGRGFEIECPPRTALKGIRGRAFAKGGVVAIGVMCETP